MHIDYDRVVAELVKAVSDKPEGYAYTRDSKAIETVRLTQGSFAVSSDDKGEYISACRYKNHDGTPGCIVGTVMDQIEPGLRLEEGPWSSHLTPGYEIDRDASALLFNVQRYQDSGKTWAYAVALAITDTPKDSI